MIDSKIEKLGFALLCLVPFCFANHWLCHYQFAYPDPTANCQAGKQQQNPIVQLLILGVIIEKAHSH